MNKREASFIMQLPDGFDWRFLNDGKFIIGGNPENEVLMYEIVDEKLIKRELIMECKV